MKRRGVPTRSILKISKIRAFLGSKTEKNDCDRDLSLILKQYDDDPIMLGSNARQFSDYVHQNGLCYEGAVFELGKRDDIDGPFKFLNCSVMAGSNAHIRWARKELAKINRELDDNMDSSCREIEELTNGLPSQALSKAQTLLARIETFKTNRQVHAKKRSLQNKNLS